MTWWIVGVLIVGTASCATWWIRYRLVVVAVTGDSMRPALSNGDRVLVRRARPATLRRGQIAVAVVGADVAARTGWIIKRVAALAGDQVPADLRRPRWTETPDAVVPTGRVLLLGDNPTVSFDSRQLGYIDEAQIVGIVIRRLVSPRQNRAGS